MGKLKELAARLGVAPEDWVRMSIDKLLAQPEEAFGRATDYILRKNTEFYRRLVQCYLTVGE